MFSITRHSILLGGSGLQVPPTTYHHRRLNQHRDRNGRGKLDRSRCNLAFCIPCWHPKWCKSRCNLSFCGANHARFVAHQSNFIYTRKSHKIDHFLEILIISVDFWQFRTELAHRSNSIYTRKSHKIDHFLEILNISGDFWQFRAELKKSIEFHLYQEIQ